MGHDHADHHGSGKNLRVAFFLNLSFTILEIVGGLYVNSVAILSDAIHDLGDSLSLGTSWFLENKSRKGSDDNYSFGYARFSLLGALINSVVLIIGSTFVINEAVIRIQHPEEAYVPGMIAFAFVGIAVNGYAAWKLIGGQSLNEKVVAWHLLEDVLGWGAVLIAAVIMFFIDFPIIDPILSLLITVYILYGVARRLKQTLFIFLQGVPKGVKADEIKMEILKINEIEKIADFHLWTLEGQFHILTIQVLVNSVDQVSDLELIRKEVRRRIRLFGIKHCTIEIMSDQEDIKDQHNEHHH